MTREGIEVNILLTQGISLAKQASLKSRDVLNTVSRALGSGGAVIPSKHFRQRGQGRNLDIQDALKVLGAATQVRAVWNNLNETWNYDLPGKAIDGEELTIRIAVIDERRIILVTGF